MFTGIVEELGTVESLDLLDGDAARLTIRGPLVTEDAGHGDSISVNGCCLTVVDTGDGTFTADVDGTGTIASRQPAEHWEVVRIAAPPEILRYVAEKGSIAVDGVSLTVTDVDDSTGTFGISLIPTTLELTVFGRNKVGDTVNLEVDVIAKYVERLLALGGN
jgi:riboflavin synthase